MEQNENIISVSEISDDFKVCRFCGKSIERDMNFCTFCGKNQKEEVINKKPKKIRKKIKMKPVKATKVLSFISFGISFFIMIYAIIRMFLFNTPAISIFGTSYETIIINQTVVIGSLIISMMFLRLGIFLYK